MWSTTKTPSSLSFKALTFSHLWFQAVASDDGEGESDTWSDSDNLSAVH